MNAAYDAGRIALMLNELRLPTIGRLWPDFAERSDKESWQASRLLGALLEHELAERAKECGHHLLAIGAVRKGAQIGESRLIELYGLAVTQGHGRVGEIRIRQDSVGIRWNARQRAKIGQEFFFGGTQRVSRSAGDVFEYRGDLLVRYASSVAGKIKETRETYDLGNNIILEETLEGDPLEVTRREAFSYDCWE